MSSAADSDALRAAAAAAGQAHIFDDWDKLSASDRERLLSDVSQLDFGFVRRVFECSIAAPAPGAQQLEPAAGVMQRRDATEAQRAEWTASGYKLIAEGRAGVLLLAGGQGTRLGSSAPKGCYNVGLPSGKSLFQLQAERLLRVQTLAAEATYGPGSAPRKPLHWYIMTSPFTHDETLAHFKQHAFFGLKEEQITFFQQGFLPCLTEQGQIIMASGCEVAKAPDGNGGLYRALRLSGCLDHMQAAGIECLDCYCVDNLLARLGDPSFIGACYTAGAEVGARVVAKAYPEEKVGVFARRGGSLQVVEYSEMDPAVACAADPASGTLMYNWSNICMHYFNVQWLVKIETQLEKAGAAYHIARKSIPSKAGPVAGIKLELFIFDTFPMAQKTALVEVERAAEFGPVKNAPGAATDSPDTARALALQLGKRWVEAAGGVVTSADGVEVSPLVSYGGEGLEWCKGQTFEGPGVPQLLGAK